MALLVDASHNVTFTILSAALLSSRLRERTSGATIIAAQRGCLQEVLLTALLTLALALSTLVVVLCLRRSKGSPLVF